MVKKWNQAGWPWIGWIFAASLLSLTACGLFQPGEEETSQPPVPTITAIVMMTSTPGKIVTLTKPPDITPSKTPSSTPSATSTAVRSPTPTAVPVTPTPEPKPYALQPGSPKFSAAFAHLEQGCQWLGVAGQVFDEAGQGANGLAVLVTGSVDGQTFERAALTQAQSAYGPGGYEVMLADHLPASGGTFQIQLYDVQSHPLSEMLTIRVPEQCQQNLVLVNFNANSRSGALFLPIMGNFN